MVIRLLSIFQFNERSICTLVVTFTIIGKKTELQWNLITKGIAIFIRVDEV